MASNILAKLTDLSYIGVQDVLGIVGIVKV